LFNIVFRETKLLSLFNNQKSVVNADVWLGKESKVNLIAEKPFNKIITPFEYNKTKVHVEWMNPLPAPILKGQKLGSIYISIPGKKTITENLVATKDVAKMSPFLRIKSIMKFLLYGEIVEN
jgi:D-alanyl-D-alanine carboxypeptidase (penicillin-binding protein 5/6)